MKASAARHGFTLIELMIGMIILGIVGATLTKMLISQTRFMDRQNAQRSARSTSRAAQNILLSDLRMVEVGGGVTAASPTSLTVKIPVTIGLYCGNATGVSTVSMLPVDQHLYANTGLTGYAWRNEAGAYTYVDAGMSMGVGAEATCTAQQISTLANGRVITLTPALPAAAALASPVMLYQLVRYHFSASVAQPGTIALWRTLLTSGVNEELAGPFDETAGFAFFVGGSAVPQAAAPGQLSTIRGIQLLLHGKSERAPSGTTTALTERLTTSVFFKNRLD